MASLDVIYNNYRNCFSLIVNWAWNKELYVPIYISLVVGKFDENSILLILKADIITCTTFINWEEKCRPQCRVVAVCEKINAMHSWKSYEGGIY